MIDKLKSFPHKVTFFIGLALLLSVLGTSNMFSADLMPILIQGVLTGVSLGLMLYSVNKNSPILKVTSKQIKKE